MNFIAHENGNSAGKHYVSPIREKVAREDPVEMRKQLISGRKNTIKNLTKSFLSSWIFMLWERSFLALFLDDFMTIFDIFEKCSGRKNTM